ncbi:alpha/beta hydrolase [Zoogloea oleivorans]|jgi:pimeloyl-ACP methyl ester carboxylesterase|uniref:Alpha/beta hydrolase n=1 Tax=Zoogloea oleivorans TaxID=1552750 RepID=A0A6C2CKE4_9RHOO|nr:alpha/beta hydrolase [Zoogloea oleivorans]TYC54527.1 alpha/beta hydrolase [Zoogloea oleivorans]
MTPSRSRFLDVRGLRYHLREWGVEGAPKIFLLHGWMDVSASFQFIVDELKADWHVIAPDWRGFGLTEWHGDSYWFPDYFADLDAILRALVPDGQVSLIGHSMGGNVACHYAGVRPARVARLIALDAFGLAESDPQQSPERFEKWLNELESGVRFRGYPDRLALAARLRADNPRLTEEKAAFLAGHLGEPDGQGGIRLAGDPSHRRVSPMLYRRAEAMASWRRVIAPTLWIEPAEPDLRRRLGVTDEAHEQARACFRDFREVQVSNSGHNLHHDQPGEVARIIETFLLPKES